MSRARDKDAGLSGAEPFHILAETAHSWSVGLDPDQLRLLRRYVDEVRTFNARTNITADADLESIVLKHLADGVACVPLLKSLASAPAPSVLDLGSGAGFIGLTVKIAWPQARVTLMEPRLRRFGFLSATVALLGLTGIRLLRREARRPAAGRAEPAQGGFDLVLARALAPLDESVLLAMPLLRPGGHFVAFQSREPDRRAASLARAMLRASAGWIGSRGYRRPGEPTDRFLTIFAKE